ncbi:uncharacterized protein METZ01_LOCUS219871 [marine metagenome]|uniref:Uncharacterized protein n=1 Tax=marine metagenome TaxID=408172 RepID=A0A382FXP5_9ZZZZ
MIPDAEPAISPIGSSASDVPVGTSIVMKELTTAMPMTHTQNDGWPSAATESSRSVALRVTPHTRLTTATWWAP